MQIQELAKNLPVALSLVYDQTQVGGTPTFVSDLHAELVILLNRASNDLGGAIAHVVSPMGFSVITSASLSSSTHSDPNITNVSFESINNVPVIVDAHADEKVPIRTVGMTSEGVMSVVETDLQNITFI